MTSSFLTHSDHRYQEAGVDIVTKTRATTVKNVSSKPRKWPRTADLMPWLECYLDLCEQHPKPDDAGIKACTSLKQLAECGQATAALTRVQRLLKRLPAKECQATAFLALTAAGICLEIPDLRRAETFLQLVEKRHAIATPRDRKPIQKRLNQFLTANGLPESAASGPLEEDSPLCKIGHLRQCYRLTLLAGDQTAASKAIQKSTRLIPEIDEFWEAPGLILSAITAIQRLGGDAAVGRYLSWLDRNGHSDDLSTGSLWGMGFTTIASKRAEKRIADRLKKLKSTPDPNLHFPVNEICKELWFLLQTGQKEIAAKQLQKVLRSLPDWPSVRGGFATAGALTDLAEVLAEIDGPEAACRLLNLAVKAGKVEPQRGFRKGALKTAHEQLEAPGLAAAITKAKSITNAKKRRETLIPLLARRASWEELVTVLDEITDVGESLETLHAVIFKIPGGDRIA